MPLKRRVARRLLSLWRGCAPKRAEADLRDKIQTIALKNRFYGYRRVAETSGASMA